MRSLFIASAVGMAVVAACSSSQNNNDSAYPVADGQDAGVDASTDSAVAPANGDGGAEAGPVDSGRPGDEAGADADADADAGPPCDPNSVTLQSDPLNCGACGKSCGGSTCTNGFCDPYLVLDALEEPYGPTKNELSWQVSQGRIYEWEKTTTNALHYIVQSTAVTSHADHGTLLQDVPLTPTIDSVAFDAAFVYEAIHGDGVVGAVARRKLDGSEGTGAATPMFTLPKDLKWEAIAVATDAVYLVGAQDTGSVADTASIYKIALPITDVSAQPTPLYTGRKNVISDLTVVGTHLFWNEEFTLADWRLFVAPTDASAAPAQMDDQIGASTSSITSDAIYVYWTTISDLGELKRCSLVHLDAAHAEHVTYLSSAQEGIVSQGEFLYGMELSERAVYRIDKSAPFAKSRLGNMQVATPSEKGTGVIGVDPNFIYVVSQSAKVWRFPIIPF